MPDDRINIWYSIEDFRGSESYEDVVWQKYGILHAPFEALRLVKETHAEFKVQLPFFLEKFTMIQSKTYADVINNNPIKDIKEIMRLAFGGELDPKSCFERLKGLRYSGVFFTSSIMTLAYGGQFIIYSDGLMDALEHLFPWLMRRIPSVTDYESYLDFQHLCEAIAESYGFESLSELHSFLWRGQDSNWEFR